MSQFVCQVVVCGNRPYTVALAVPNWISKEDLVNNDSVKGLISAEIKLNCYRIKKFEILAAFFFIAPFVAANNMVTPKMTSPRGIQNV